MIPRLSTSRDAAIVTTSHIEVTSRRCSSEAKGECFVSVLVLIFLLQAATHLFTWIQSLPHCGMTMTVCGGNASCRRPYRGRGKLNLATRKCEVIPVTRLDNSAATYLVGGGIASLAAAAFLIRDGDVPGHTITILEESSRIGGSLDARGNTDDGYVMRGGRMIESKYLCTYDLFSSIPTLDGTRTVTQEIFDWNETMKTASKARLFRDGHRVDGPSFGLSEKDILNLERLALGPESLLGRSRISDQFDPAFFETDFWHMWCTTFAFQP
jgi:oleate hydratase